MNPSNDLQLKRQSNLFGSYHLKAMGKKGVGLCLVIFVCFQILGIKNILDARVNILLNVVLAAGGTFFWQRFLMKRNQDQSITVFENEILFNIDPDDEKKVAYSNLIGIRIFLPEGFKKRKEYFWGGMTVTEIKQDPRIEFYSKDKDSQFKYRVEVIFFELWELAHSEAEPNNTVPEATIGKVLNSLSALHQSGMLNLCMPELKYKYDLKQDSTYSGVEWCEDFFKLTSPSEEYSNSLPFKNVENKWVEKLIPFESLDNYKITTYCGSAGEIIHHFIDYTLKDPQGEDQASRTSRFLFKGKDADLLRQHFELLNAFTILNDHLNQPVEVEV